MATEPGSGRTAFATSIGSPSRRSGVTGILLERPPWLVAFSIGGVVFSLLLLVVGLILNNQKSFATDYVRTELTAQKINFTPAKFLSDEEKKAASNAKQAKK